MSEKKRLSRALPVLAALLMIPALPAPSAALDTERLQPCDFGEHNPEAPDELDQFAFLVGNWNIEARVRKPDGSWNEQTGRAYWEGRWILDGWAISDFWYDAPPVAGTNPGRGVNVRMFRPELGQWTNMWQHIGLAEVRTLMSEVREDGLMHMWASHPDTSDRRRMRFEIADEDHWVRIEERRRDDGSWLEVVRLEASRAPCPWKPPVEEDESAPAGAP